MVAVFAATFDLHGVGVDQVLADEAEGVGVGGGVLWSLADHEGTVRDVINSAGSIENHIEYDSFGNITAESDDTVEFRYSYTGRELDAETGLYYYRARYYDPATARFIGEDPLGFSAGDMNLYRYVGNNPMTMTDPSGLCWSGSSNSYNSIYGTSEFGSDANASGIVSSGISSNLGIASTFGISEDILTMSGDTRSYYIGLEADIVRGGREFEQQWYSPKEVGVLDHIRAFVGGIGKGAIDLGKGIGKGVRYTATGAWDTLSTTVGLAAWGVTGEAGYAANAPTFDYATNSLNNMDRAMTAYGQAVKSEHEGAGWVASSTFVAETVLRNIPVAGKLGSNIADIGENGYSIENSTSFGESTFEIGTVLTLARLSGTQWTRPSAPNTGFSFSSSGVVSGDPTILYSSGVVSQYTGLGAQTAMNATISTGVVSSLTTPEMSGTMMNVPKVVIPQEAISTLEYIRRTGRPPQGYQGGRVFKNREGNLPQGGRYREYDIAPKPPKGQTRGAKRIVVDEESGQAWYTEDHYTTFTEIK